MEAADIASSSTEFQKYVSILVDEMHIKEDLVYNKSTGNSYMGMMHTSYVSLIDTIMIQ